MNGYELSRIWFDFCFENPEKVKPNHSAIYFFAIEHCNRLGWKEKFGLPSSMTMEAIGIKSYNTYIKALNEIVDWGFIVMVEKSKNQYSSNIIALSKFNKALDKALDKAFIKHTSKQSESTLQSIGESIDSINKQLTIKPLNQLTNRTKNQLDAFYKKLKIEFEKKEDKEINHQEIISVFNTVCIHLPKIQKLTKTRKSSINARVIDYDLETIGKVYQIVSESAFLNGENDRNWKADFDWIMNPNNFIKILEGKYNTNGKQNSETGQGASKYFRAKTAERLGIV